MYEKSLENLQTDIRVLKVCKQKAVIFSSMRIGINFVDAGQKKMTSSLTMFSQDDRFLEELAVGRSF